MQGGARRSWRGRGIVALCAALIACRTEDAPPQGRSTPVPSTTTSALAASAPSASGSSPAAPSGGPAPSSGPPWNVDPTKEVPRPFPILEGPPAQLRSPVLFDVASGSWVGGMALDARPLVRDLVVGDPVGIALRVRLPGDQETYFEHWALLRAFTFDVHAPDGVTHHLEADGLIRGHSSWMLQLDAAGVSADPDRHAWKSPVPDLFSAAGTYRIEASADVQRDAGEWRRLQSGTLTFDIRAPSAERVPLASIAPPAAAAG